MTFAIDESSVEDSRPREGYEIILPSVTYRVARGREDVVIGGQKYTAFSIDREGEENPSVLNQSELRFSLPASHPFPQRWSSGGIPPKRVTVNVRRYQQRSGLSVIIWQGVVADVSFEGHIARVRVPSRSAMLVPRKLPTVSVSRNCPHMLYDTQCRVVRADFTITTTVTHVDGPFVTVASDGGHVDQYYQYGDLKHIASGETMTVLDHTGNVMTLQFRIAELKVGDGVQVAVGCDHTIQTCFLKFANEANFGGLPYLPNKNIYLYNGLGIWTSE